MKDKLILVLLAVIVSICLVGCDTNSTSIDNLLNALQKEEIVDKNLELLDTIIETEYLVPSRTTYYIYKESNSNIIAINYNTNIYAKNDYDYSITIYYNVVYNEDLSTYDWNEYNLDNRKEYIVYETKPLFSKTKYSIEEVN